MSISQDDPYFQDGEQPPKQPDDQPAYSREEEPSDQPKLFDDALPGQPAEHLLPYLPEDDENQNFDYSRMDDDVAAFHRELNAVQVPSSVHPLEEEPLPEANPAPRRRRRSLNLTEGFTDNDLGERLQSITQRTSPNVDFFVLSLLCGLILGIGYILDAPAILLIGIFIAPILGPLVGSALSATTGETSLFRLTFGGLFVGLILVFVVGILAGFTSRLFHPLTFSQALFHARLWWPDLLMLVLGTAALVISYIQSDDKPVIPSLMVVYELYLPVSAAGFGLGSGVQGLWPQAILVFLIHLALALIISLVIFFFMGFRPLERNGYVLTAGIILIGVVILVSFAGFGSLINIRADQAYATALAAPTATREIATITTQPEPSQTPVPIIAVSSLQPTRATTSTPSQTPPPPSATVPAIPPTFASTSSTKTTPAATLLPTPVYGRVQSPQSDGVLVRIKPAGKSITTVQNGYLAQIMGDTPVVADGSTWIHVIITTPHGDIDGWVIMNLIVTATPSFSP